MDPSTFGLISSIVLLVFALCFIGLLLYIPYRVFQWAIRGMAASTFKTVSHVRSFKR